MLTLCMILKDEAAGIAETLASVKPYVDRWVIGDTGSTDGTPRIVLDVMGDMEGQLFELEFQDFSQARNAVLDVAGTETEFTLMLSGDETLVGGDALRDFCKKHEGADEGAYHIRARLGEAHYDSARLARSRAGWRYVGVTHEVMVKPGEPPPKVRVPGVTIVHGPYDEESKRRRRESDRVLLEAELRRAPEDARATFYYAQTLHLLGLYEAAHAAYVRRVELGGWREEVFESKLRMAQTAELAGKGWPEVMAHYLAAYAQSPHRAEPLYAIAEHYNAEENWPLVLLFAGRGMELPLPVGDTLFVEEEVYSWKCANLVGVAAYWTGDLEVGEKAVRRAIRARPDDPRLAKNLTFYLTRGAP